MSTDTEQQVGSIDAAGNWMPPEPSSNAVPPPGEYRLHILKVDQKPTKKGMPMDTFEFEIISPETATIDGQNCRIAGHKLTHWNSFQLEGKGAALLGNAIEFAGDCGVNLTQIRAKSPADYIKQLQVQSAKLGGMAVTATLAHEPRYKLRQLTPEQKALGERPTEELDANGQKIVTGNRLVIKSLHKGTATRIGGF